MRVLYAAFDVVPSPKGASRHIAAFGQALVDAGYKVTLLTVGLPGMPASEMQGGLRILRVRCREDNFLRRALHFGDAVWEHLREREGAYDVVHFRDIWSGQAALQARQGFGYRYHTLFEANGLPSVELKYHYPALVGTDLPARFLRQERAILGQVEAIVCVSAVTAIYLQSLGAPPQVVTRIPNGVDPTLFQPVEAPAGKPPRLVYAGTLASWQGIPTLIEAMPTILAACPEAELRLIGPAKKGQQKALAKMASKLGLEEETVQFAGPVEPEAIRAPLAAAAVCLAPLAYNDRNVSQGCCPIKVLEYGAVGRPIVAADLPVVRELLGEGEALFFQPGNATELARQVIYLLSHPEEGEALAQRASARIRRQFTWQQSGERLLEVYARFTGPVPAGRGPATLPAPAGG